MMRKAETMSNSTYNVYVGAENNPCEFQGNFTNYQDAKAKAWLLVDAGHEASIYEQVESAVHKRAYENKISMFMMERNADDARLEALRMTNFLIDNMDSYESGCVYREVNIYEELKKIAAVLSYKER